MARFVALSTHEVTWQGTAAHAQTPWQGVSALDASVTAYQSIALLRSQLPPGSSVHGILGSCDDSLVESPYVTTSSAMLGTSPSSYRSNSSSPPLSGAAGVSLRQRAFYCSAVVSRATAYYALRALDIEALGRLRTQVDNCFAAASLSTGATHQATTSTTYLNLIDALSLSQDYARYMANGQGIMLEACPSAATQSSDIGNVSHILPCLVALFKIADAGSHTPAFARAARSPAAHQACWAASKGIAASALRLLADNAFSREVSETWSAARRAA